MRICFLQGKDFKQNIGTLIQPENPSNFLNDPLDYILILKRSSIFFGTPRTNYFL